MRRSTFVFFVFVVLIGVIFGANSYFRNQPPLTLTLVVDPLAEAWARVAVERFNAQNVLLGNGTSRVVVRIEAIQNDVAVWQERANWTVQRHPHLWLASSSASLAYLTPNLPYTSLGSMARSPLMWGGFTSRVSLVTQSGALPFDWQAVQAVAQAQRWQALGAPSQWGNVNIGINWASNAMSGLGVLASASASYHNTATLSRDALSDPAFLAWFAPIKDAVQNAQRLGESPASAMASRGASVADLALLPEVQWLKALNSLLRQEPVIFAYPAYQVILDFPLSYWNDANTTPAEAEAARLFANYLLSEPSQQLAVSEGLRPANADPRDSDTLFATSVPYGVRLSLLNVQTVAPYDRALADQLLRLLN
jgi:hypothetical protein